MNKRPTVFIRLSVLFLGIIFVGAGCLGGGSNLTPPEKVTLEWWRFEDGAGSVEDSIKGYKQLYPNVTITVKVLKQEEYEAALFTAWSKGEGPDIFSVPNWRLGKFKEFVTPMPKEAYKLKTSHVESSFGKKTVVTEQNTIVPQSAEQIRDQFVAAVAGDVVSGSRVYALPLSIDTLGMYYNRDLLAKAQVAVPPTTWDEFVAATQAMVIHDTEKNIVQPATALGTAGNIPHYFDIVSLIMMQNGTTMVTDTGRVAFAVGEDAAAPGPRAMDFYTAFSNPLKRTYTWDDEQLNALESFTQGDLGFYFGYYSDKADIDQRAPNLNYSYTKVPQIDLNNPINYANYTVESVHLTTESPEHAWNFLRYASAQKQVKGYLEATKKIPALKTLIGESQEDTEIGIFAQQALTAETWYHGHDPDAAMSAFTEMIDTINQRIDTIQSIMNIAAAKVRLTIEQQ